jgi:hypothetical protein
MVFRLVFIAAAVLAAGPVAAASFSAVGTWTVSQVRNDPSMQVTALVDDDPAYMGAKLTIAPDGIRWAKGASNGEGTYDDCRRPGFVLTAAGLEVVCDGGDWGPPEAVLRPLSRDRLELEWYDGGILTLSRD